VLEPEPDPLDGDAEDEAELLEVASGDDGEEDDCVFVPVASVPADEGDIEGGNGGSGTVFERLGLFVAIVAEASVVDGEE
jgi:hypothetical protein